MPGDLCLSCYQREVEFAHTGFAERGEPVRYNELKRKLNGITGTTLTNCLKDLIDYGIIHREQYHEVPPRVEYSLTPAGKELVPLIEDIVAWGTRNMHVPG